MRVQPGVTLATLNERLACEGRRFAPDPASGQVCTIGGMLATNASGSAPAPRLHARSRRFAAHRARHRRDRRRGQRDLAAPRRPGARRIGTTSSAADASARAARRADSRPAAAHRFNRCGYLAGRRLFADGARPAQAARRLGRDAGLFTEATLRTVPLPGGQALVLLGFASLERRSARRKSLPPPARSPAN